MNRVVTAIEGGRCVVAVSGALLRDAEVMLALTDRVAMPSVALSGPAINPVRGVTPESIAAAVAQPGGVVVIVEPELVDHPGMGELARHLQRGANTPTVLVVAKAFNPFLYNATFRNVAVAHLKGRGKDFLKRLPMPPAGLAAVVAETAAAPKKKKAGSDIPAPRFTFVGRDEELASLGEMLGSGGPIVVSGPPGVGKTSLVEAAISGSGLTRLPDLNLGWGTGADALFGRLAEIASENGSDLLAERLNEPHKPLEVVAATIAALKAADVAADKVMVVRNLQYALGREADFFRKGRLEVAVMALLTNSYPLRIVFLSTRQPVFYRHGVAEVLRRVELGGLKGRFLFDIFDAYKAPEFSRDKFGPFAERTFGHPMVARQAAIDVRDREEGAELMDGPKWLKMESLEDVAPLKKLLGKRLEKLPDEGRRAVSKLAHLRYPIDGGTLSSLGLSRTVRLHLLARGFLEMVGTEEDKGYRVHSLVRSCLSWREIADFDTYAELGELYRRRGNGLTGVARIAAVQEANRCLVAGRKARDRVRLKYPDGDPLLESVMGMIRGSRTNFEVAELRLRDILKYHPANSEAHLLMAELLARSGAEKEAIAACYDAAMEQAPVPEVFHQACGWYLSRRARGKAIDVMEAAVEAIPDDARLRTRLAALLLRQGRRRECIERLREAMAMDPMLPDAYGLLGMARSDEGLEALDEAESLLREAVRLAPDDPVQTPRLVRLLLARARVDPDKAEALRAEARELLETVLKGERKGAETYIMLAQLTREEGGDPERCVWLLKRARKLTERSQERSARISLEFARVDTMRGNLDAAETAIRDLAQRDPSSPDVFLALADVLEARQLYIPAHAETTCALERVPAGSLERLFVEQRLARLEATVRAQIAGLDLPGVEPEEKPMYVPQPLPEPPHHRVIRRRPESAQSTIVPEEVDADPATADAAPADAAGLNGTEADEVAVEVEAHAEVETSDGEVEAAAVVVEEEVVEDEVVEDEVVEDEVEDEVVEEEVVEDEVVGDEVVEDEVVEDEAAVVEAVEDASEE